MAPVHEGSLRQDIESALPRQAEGTERQAPAVRWSAPCLDCRGVAEVHDPRESPYPAGPADPHARERGPARAGDSRPAFDEDQDQPDENAKTAHLSCVEGEG